MTPEQMKAYVCEQLATIDREEAEAHQLLEALRFKLSGLEYARQAYQDVLDELEKQPESEDA